MFVRTVALAALAALLASLGPGGTGAHAASTCRGRAVTIEVQPGSTVRGTPGDDVALVTYGSSGRFDAGNGDDLVCVVPGAEAPGSGSYVVTGGHGTDTVVFDVDVDIDVKLDRSATWGNSEVGLAGLENAVVSGRRVVVYGTKADNLLVARSTDGALLTGKDGDDVLRLGLVAGGDNHDGLRLASGGPGNDVLTGSPVDDVLTGGPGHDRAVGRAGKDVCTAEVRRSCELR
jgi:Ca2+-binding RTX toxin-like protein